jgi:hypothetical protein
VNTSGANHKLPSKLLTKSEQHNAHINISQTQNPVRSYLQRSEERSAHITVSLVEAPTIEHYYYYSILQDARMHNVTMRIVANGLDYEALHIAFGETLSSCSREMNGF